MSILLLLLIMFAAALAETVPELIRKTQPRRAAVINTLKQKGKNTMLTVLCILLFPIVVLGELLKISN